MEFAIFIPIVLGTGCFMMISFIVFVNSRAKQRRAEVQAQVQSKLIERFGTATELVSFLKTDEGKNFLGDIESAPAMNARDRIIRGMGKAIILGLLGIGFLTICIFPETRNEGFIIAGCILVALGLGYFLAALVSLKLSRNWGLMEPQHPDAAANL